MPRVTHVKKAQQRYATRPVIDPATGEQKKTPVVNKMTGEQKVTKSGRPVYLRITERDLERPLPMPQCDYAMCEHESREIAVGSPYKWIEPSGQQVRNRHADCPTWQVWEYSNSLSARIAQITSEDPEDFDSPDDWRSWAEAKAEEIRGLSEEKRESAENIVEGFGHETYQSEELNEIADSLETWADDLEAVDIPELPEADEDAECDECEGTGQLEGPDETACPACDGTGQSQDEEPDPTEEQMDEWRSECRDAISAILDDCPV